MFERPLYTELQIPANTTYNMRQMSSVQRTERLQLLLTCSDRFLNYFFMFSLLIGSVHNISQFCFQLNLHLTRREDLKGRFSPVDDFQSSSGSRLKIRSFLNLTKQTEPSQASVSLHVSEPGWEWKTGESRGTVCFWFCKIGCNLVVLVIISICEHSSVLTKWPAAGYTAAPLSRSLFSCAKRLYASSGAGTLSFTARRPLHVFHTNTL